MKIAIINVTTLGNNIVNKLVAGLSQTLEKLTLNINNSKDKNFDFKECCKFAFENHEAVIFISSTGIAVRGIAPHVANKKSDPAVIVIDSSCKYAISLLSGHLGGANKLTKLISEILGCEAVITTATDNLGLTAPDIIAAENNLYIEDMKVAKAIATLLVEGKPVGFFDEEEEIPCPRGYLILSQLEKGKCFKEEYPQVLVEKEKGSQKGNGYSNHGYREKSSLNEEFNLKKESTWAEYETRENQDKLEGIVIVTSKIELALPEKFQGIPVLKLIRKNIILGIGCKKHFPSENMIGTVKNSLKEKNIHEKAVAKISTVSIKKEEAAMLALGDAFGIELKTFTPEEIKPIEHKYGTSEFVRKTIGVGAVCEPVIELSGGALLYPKESFKGMTLAIGRVITPSPFNIE